MHGLIDMTPAALRARRSAWCVLGCWSDGYGSNPAEALCRRRSSCPVRFVGTTSDDFIGLQKLHMAIGDTFRPLTFRIKKLLNNSAGEQNRKHLCKADLCNVV